MDTHGSGDTCMDTHGTGGTCMDTHGSGGTCMDPLVLKSTGPSPSAGRMGVSGYCPENGRSSNLENGWSSNFKK